MQRLASITQQTRARVFTKERSLSDFLYTIRSELFLLYILNLKGESRGLMILNHTILTVFNIICDLYFQQTPEFIAFDSETNVI